MSEITREILASYLDDSLGPIETAAVEKALRESDSLRQILKDIVNQLDRGEHTLGAIWRRERLSCPTREQLGAYLLQALDSDLQEYIEFHLDVVDCPFCQANLTDLKSVQESSTPEIQKRRQRFWDSSVSILKTEQKSV